MPTVCTLLVPMKSNNNNNDDDDDDDDDGGGGGGDDDDDSRGSQLPPDAVSHRAHVGPTEAAATQQHVSNERLDGCLAHKAHKEQLLDYLRADSPEGR